MSITLSMSIRLLTHATALVALCWLSGCGGPKGFQSAWSKKELAAGNLRVESSAQLQSALNDRVTDHDQLWARSDITLRRGDKKDFFSALALYRAPDDIRLRGSRLQMNIFDLLIRGDNIYLYFNRQGERYDGTMADLAAKSDAIGGMTPRELVAALLVQQELRGWLASGRAVATHETETHLLLAARHPVSDRQLLWGVRKADGLVEELLVRTPEGRSELRIVYTGYSLEKNPETGFREPLPKYFQLEIPGTKIEATIDEYKLKPDLVNAAFEPPPARDVYRLADVEFKESP